MPGGRSALGGGRGAILANMRTAVVAVGQNSVFAQVEVQ